jgi:hypothetical protein
MLQSSSSGSMRRRFLLQVGAALLVAAASAPLRADESSASVSVWGPTGAGHPDSHTSTSTAPGDTSGVNVANAQAIGCFAHADGNAITGAWNGDVGLSARARSYTSYQLSVAAACGAQCTWSASGTMNWNGTASVETWLDADGTASAIAYLGYSGDLALTGSAAVAAATAGSAGKEVEWEFSLTPSYTQKCSRSSQANSDSCSGGAMAQSNGTGSTVRVDVLSFAEATVVVDANAFGFGMGVAKAKATNRGDLTMTVSVAWSREGDPGPTAGGGGGDGPTTGSGGDGEDPIGGRRVYRVYVDELDMPVSTEGGVVPSGSAPDEPKPVPGPVTSSDPTGATDR